MATEVVKIVDTGGSGDYSSLSAWEAGEQKDLVTADEIAIADCRCTIGAADTTAVTIKGWTTDSTRYIKIWTDPAQGYRHDGKWNDGKYRLCFISSGNYQHVLEIGERHTKVEGLQLELDANGYSDCGIINLIDSDSVDIAINKCILKGIENGGNFGHGGIYLTRYTSSDISAKIINSIIYGCGGSYSHGIYAGTNISSVEVYNCIISGSYYGIIRESGIFTVENTAVFNNTDDIKGTVTITYSAGDDPDFASGTGNIQWTGGATDWNNNFVDYANGDFHLKSTAPDLIDVGTDLSSEGFADDIDGDTRSAPWDIGADEYAAAVGALIKIINETLQFNEATLKLQSTQKVVNETLQLSESVGKKGTTKKIINETLQINESTPKTRGMIKIISETLQIAESFAKISGITKVVNEALQLSESISRKIGITKIVNETLQLVEGIKKLSWTTKIVNETLRFSEALFKRGTTKKVINETLQIAESLAKITGITKVVNETLQLSETVLQKTGITKIINETLQISEKIKKLSWTTKVVNETLQLSETLFKKVSIKKIINETLQLSENIARKSGLIKIINEVLNIGENIIRTLAIALGWREVVKGDSRITTMITGDSPLD